MKSSTITPYNPKKPPTPTSQMKTLLGAFDTDHLIAGANKIALTKYSCLLAPQSDKKTITSLPEQLSFRTLIIQKLATLELKFKRHLHSDKTSAELLTPTHEQLGFVPLLSELDKQLWKIESSTLSSARLSPLIERLKEFLQTFSFLPQQRPFGKATVLDPNATRALDTLRQSLPNAQSLHRTMDEKTQYERDRDQRIRNCNKRRKTANEIITNLIDKCQNPLVVQIAFVTKRPFTAGAINPAFETPSKPTHFVNAFLGLRNKRPYKKTLFKGMTGYFRKLELIDSCHALGGYITLIFDQDKVDLTPYELGNKLIALLAKMSPDEDIEEHGTFRYVFKSEYFFDKSPVTYKNLSLQRWFIDILSVVNFYTHADYFLDQGKRSAQKNKTPNINAYSSGSCL